MDPWPIAEGEKKFPDKSVFICVPKNAIESMCLRFWQNFTDNCNDIFQLKNHSL